MSSFSSVIQKPGKRIIPRATPRRNAPQRKSVPAVVSETVNSQNDAQHIEEHATVNIQSTQLIQDDVRISGVHEYPSVSRPSPPISERIQESTSQDTGVDIISQSQNSNSASAVSGDDVPIQARQNPSNADAGDNHVKIDKLTERVARSSEQVEARSVDQDPQNIPSRPAEQRLETESPLDINGIEETRSTQRGSIEDVLQHTASPRKKRKITPRAAPDVGLSQGTPIPTPSPLPSLRSHTISRHSALSQPADDLIQSATRQAATVSELANSIEFQTRSLQPRTERNLTLEADLAVGLDVSDPSATPVSQYKGSRRKKTLQEQAAEVVANAIGRHSGSARYRDSTPENAQEYELEPASVTMGELCEDNKLGKKSALEAEMQANWPEIVQRRREDRERALVNAEKRRRKGIGQKSHLLAPLEPVVALAPAMAVVNGVIVVDQASREIDRSAQLQQTAVQDLQNIREDKDYYKYVNQSTVGIKPGHTQYAKWDEESTELFFKGLRMFGTDFLMIANMFPGMTRKQIKTKFIREENADKLRVLDCLRNREPVQLEDYAQMANKGSDEFHTLESIQKELDDQERQLREEDNQRRKREGFITADDSGKAQTGGLTTNDDGAGRHTESAEPGRFDAVVDQIVEAAVAPKKRQRKSAAANNRRGPKGARRPEGGIEEILGSITEVAV